MFQMLYLSIFSSLNVTGSDHYLKVSRLVAFLYQFLEVSDVLVNVEYLH